MYGYDVFHEELMKNLIESVHIGVSSHAYIFEGKSGLGKMQCARLFAAALTCTDSTIAPCGACHNCIEAKADTNPDIVYVRPKKDKKSIGADDMRELEEDVIIKPFNAKRKVYIIEDGLLLTEAAQNVFLKTFEEPPEYAVFIILIDDAENLLQTIRSRFTLIHFPNVSDSQVESYIRNKYPDEERVDFLVKYCAGIPGTADIVINDEEFDALRNGALEKLFLMFSSDKRSAFVIEKYFEENKENAVKILEFWLSFLRDVLLMQTGASTEIINIDKREHLRKIASKINPEMIVKLSEKVVTSEKMIARYVNTKAMAMWLALKSS
ncbi:MAG: hypothetical protein IJX57_07850 [Clostridia bacterium]|nr:hypothetical protein [Clostridia bacterium]